MAEDVRTFRNHFLSVYQSAAAEYSRKVEADASGQEMPGGGPDMLEAATEAAALRQQNRSELPAGPVEEGVLDVAQICASLGLRYFEALVSGDKARAALIAEQMKDGTCDPRWASTLKAYSEYFGVDGTRRTIPYVPPSAASKPIEIKAGARVALFGDWGTGGKPARRVLEAIKAQRPDVLVHLGDIYYSGTQDECAANFADVISDVFKRDAGGIPVFTLAGNHDMYSGGVAYYGLLGRLNAAPSTQKNSFFCLRTADGQWQLLAMDTGLHDYSPLSVTNALTFVEDAEQQWLEDRVREFGGQTILLSHHQLFSAFSQIGKPGSDGKLTTYNPNLLGLFRRLQATTRPIPAWFWGHEHNLCIYKSHLGLERGRCVGHGAIPIYEQEKPYLPLPNAIDPPALTADTELRVKDGVYEHGFAVIQLGTAGAKTKVQYFTERGGTSPEEF